MMWIAAAIVVTTLVAMASGKVHPVLARRHSWSDPVRFSWVGRAAYGRAHRSSLTASVSSGSPEPHRHHDSSEVIRESGAVR